MCDEKQEERVQDGVAIAAMEKELELIDTKFQLAISRAQSLERDILVREHAALMEEATRLKTQFATLQTELQKSKGE